MYLLIFLQDLLRWREGKISFWELLDHPYPMAIFGLLVVIPTTLIIGGHLSIADLPMFYLAAVQALLYCAALAIFNLLILALVWRIHRWRHPVRA